METIILALSQAKKTIRISTPYSIPTDQLTSALVIAAANGIKVELILPAKSDSFIIDSNLAFVGTVNIDIRSFYLNFEITSIIHEPDLCREMENHFENDKQSSRPVTLEQWQSRSVFHRGMDSVCRLLSALL